MIPIGFEKDGVELNYFSMIATVGTPTTVAALRAIEGLPPAWLLSGLVYDVATGQVEVVAAPAPIGSFST